MLAFILVALLVIAWPAPAIAAESTPETRARAAEIYALAEKEDESFAFDRALAHYDEARALDPTSPHAPRADARADLLRKHAEGGFAPLAKLERVRRDPRLASDPAAIDALVRDADAFPEGLVRVEAWTLAAEAYAHRLDRPNDAVGLYAKIVAAKEADPVVAKKAARDLVTLHVARGDLAGAQEAVRLAGDRADPKLASDVARLRRRRSLHYASIGALALAFALAARAVAKARRRVVPALRRIAPLATAYTMYVGLAGAFLASRYEEGTAKPFLLFGAVLAPILFVARAWGAAGGSTPAERGLRAAASFAAAIAAAFLVLEGIDGTYLEGMGL